MSQQSFKEYMLQGNVLAEKGHYEEAIQYYEKAEEIDPMSSEMYVTKGIALASLDRLDDAKIQFEKALKINKELGVAWFHLGSLAIMTDDLEGGIVNYNKALGNGYDHAQLYYSLGLIYEERREFDLAIRNYSKGISRDALRPDIHIRKVNLHIKNGNVHEALQAVDEMILSNPDIYEGYHMKFLVLLDHDKYEEAEAVIIKAIALFPEDVRFKLDLVRCYLHQGKQDEGRIILESLETDEGIEDDIRRKVYMELAQMHATEGNLDKAITVLDKAVAISEKYEMYDEEVKFLLMNCYLGLEKFEEVLSVSRDLIEHAQYSEHQNSARYFEPMALKMLGNEEEAMPLYEQAINDLRSQSLERPGEMDLYLLRIMCLRDIKAYEKAMELLDYVMTLLPDRMEPKVVKVSLLEAMGHTDEAKKLGEEVRVAMPEAFVGV